MSKFKTKAAPTTTRNVLVVDDESNIVNALKRSLRRDGYAVFTATSGEKGLQLLLTQPDIGVIISDQRMPQMTGVDFLRKVKTRHPDTIRIVLSSYTDLESVTQAINEGAIYKFLTKPWDDELLRNHIKDAFEHYEMTRENRRLTLELQHANETLFRLNQSLARNVQEKTKEITHSMTVLQISQEILENLPVGIIGIDETYMIVATNRVSEQMFKQHSLDSLLGMMAYGYLPSALLDALTTKPMAVESVKSIDIKLDNGETVNVLIGSMGRQSCSKGWIVMLKPLTGRVICLR
jgi:response regulator RpfG family c-di-GMP phosphodiesterase